MIKPFIISTLLFTGAYTTQAQEIKLNIIDAKLQLPADSILTNQVDLLSKSKMINPIRFRQSYHKSLGFFCHAENKIAKSTKIPIKMRLGTVQYVDKIEGK